MGRSSIGSHSLGPSGTGYAPRFSGRAPEVTDYPSDLVDAAAVLAVFLIEFKKNDEPAHGLCGRKVLLEKVADVLKIGPSHGLAKQLFGDEFVSLACRGYTEGPAAKGSYHHVLKLMTERIMSRQVDGKAYQSMAEYVHYNQDTILSILNAGSG